MEFKNNTMRVLLLGGTGAMGAHLAQFLADADIETVVTSRTYKPVQNKITFRQGNAKEMDYLRTLLEEPWDAIVDFMVYSEAEFNERVNLLLAATSQYVFLSSSRVYASSDVPLTETSSRLLDVTKDDEYLQTNEYALAKARQENLLINAKQKNWTIIRPYITYSEIRLQLGVLEKEAWLYRALKGRTIVFSKDIALKMTTLTYGLDVATGIGKILGDSRAFGEVFHITSQKALMWQDILAIYFDVLEQRGYKPKVLLTETAMNLQSRSAQYQVKYDRLFNRQFDNHKIGQFIDVDCFRSAECCLRDCLNKFLDDPKFNGIDWAMEAKRDRLTHERSHLSEMSTTRQMLAYIS